MHDFHPHQLSILQKLMYANGLKYSEIKPKSMEGSKFTFHLDKLIDSGFVSKSANKYSLSTKGKEFANRMDIGDLKIESQAKISVIMVCKKIVGKKTKYLLYTRFKSPFYGYQGFPTGKVKKGENILGAAQRELKEETKLIGNPQLFSVLHYKIYDSNKILLEDKIFFAYKFENTKGVLKSGPEGEYKWVDEDKVWDYLKNPVPEIKVIFNALKNSEITFIEKEYSTVGF